MGAHGMSQSQELAAEQAALMTCSHEISRLRVDLAVTSNVQLIFRVPCVGVAVAVVGPPTSFKYMY